MQEAVSNTHSFKSYDQNFDGAADGMILSSKDFSQILVDYDFDRSWDTWEIRTGGEVIRLENRVGRIFTKILIQKRQPEKISEIRLRFNTKAKAYEVADVRHRPPLVHTWAQESEEWNATLNNCKTSPANSTTNTIQSGATISTQAVQEFLQASGAIDSSCATVDTEARQFNLVASALADNLSQSDSDSRSFLSCISNAGWALESLQVQSFLDKQATQPTRSLIRCEKKQPGKPPGEINEGTGQITIRDLKRKESLTKLVHHEILHAATGANDPVISKQVKCCPPGVTVPTCSNSKASATRTILQRLISNLNNSPELKNGLLEVYSTKGEIGIKALSVQLDDLSANLLTSMPEKLLYCGRPNTATHDCDALLNTMNRRYLNHAKAWICGQIMCSNNEPLPEAQLAKVTSECNERKDSCPIYLSQFNETAVPVMESSELEELLMDPDSNQGAQATAARQSFPPIAPENVAIGTKVDLNNASQARVAIRNSERQAFSISRNAKDVYSYVAHATNNFTQALGTAVGARQVREAGVGAAAQAPTYDPVRVAPIDGKVDSARSLSPRLDPQPGRVPVSFPTPQVPDSNSSYVPIAESQAPGRGADGGTRNKMDAPARILGIPIVNPVQALPSQLKAFASGAAMAGAGRGGSGRGSAQKNSPTPGRSPAETDQEDEDFLATLQKPFTQVQILLDDPSQRTLLMRYLDNEQIRVFPPFGKAFGHSRPKTRIIYSNATSQPEVRRVGR